MTHNRGRALRKKVKTPFGSLYAEIDFNDDFLIEQISIAHPSKHRDTAVGTALESLAYAFNELIKEMRLAREEKNRQK